MPLKKSGARADIVITMGLSASQARLLSITARLSDNELHSQSIANAKVCLADKTQEASKEYIEALNTKKLVFTTYDAKGNSTMQSLTPAFLYQYTPMKNQYVMQDSNGNYLLSAEDIKNYQETNDLMEFLLRYDVFSDDKYQQALLDYKDKYADYQEQMQEFNSEMDLYNIENEKYNAEKTQYDTEFAAWDADRKAYEAAYQQYLEDLSKPQLYDIFSGFVGTSDNPNSNAGFCYKAALNGDSGCYKHLLAYLLDYGGGSDFYTGEYETSYTDPATGQKAKTTLSSGSGAGMSSHVRGRRDWLDIVDAINDSSRMCDGDDDFGGTGDSTKENIIQKAIDEGRVPTQKEILMSDYLYDETNNKVIGLKTLKQKAIDILYILNNNISLTSDEMKATLINFTDGDMRNLSSPPTEPPPFTKPAPKPPTRPIEPKEPEKPTYSAEIDDQDKAQWYVNLWYMMNGSETANLVKEDPNTDFNGVFQVASVPKSSNGKYKALDDNLMKSEAWIQFALEHGIVTLVQAKYNNPTMDSAKSSEITSEGITWKSTIWSSCVDISSVDDEAAIARAEANYNHKLNEIEIKDKKYDNEIKKLDTEHNALQTEYESIKEVINKNIERSFKAFS